MSEGSRDRQWWGRGIEASTSLLLLLLLLMLFVGHTMQLFSLTPPIMRSCRRGALPHLTLSSKPSDMTGERLSYQKQWNLASITSGRDTEYYQLLQAGRAHFVYDDADETSALDRRDSHFTEFETQMEKLNEEFLAKYSRPSREFSLHTERSDVTATQPLYGSILSYRVDVHSIGRNNFTIARGDVTDISSSPLFRARPTRLVSVPTEQREHDQEVITCHSLCIHLSLNMYSMIRRPPRREQEGKEVQTQWKSWMSFDLSSMNNNSSGR